MADQHLHKCRVVISNINGMNLGRFLKLHVFKQEEKNTSHLKFIITITSFYIVHFTPEGLLKALPTLLLGLKLFLKPSQLPGEYTAYATITYALLG